MFFECFQEAEAAREAQRKQLMRKVEQQQLAKEGPKASLPQLGQLQGDLQPVKRKRFFSGASRSRRAASRKEKGSDSEGSDFEMLDKDPEDTSSQETDSSRPDSASPLSVTEDYFQDKTAHQDEKENVSESSSPADEVVKEAKIESTPAVVEFASIDNRVEAEAVKKEEKEDGSAAQTEATAEPEKKEEDKKEEVKKESIDKAGDRWPRPAFLGMTSTLRLRQQRCHWQTAPGPRSALVLALTTTESWSTQTRTKRTVWEWRRKKRRRRKRREAAQQGTCVLSKPLKSSMSRRKVEPKIAKKKSGRTMRWEKTLNQTTTTTMIEPWPNKEPTAMWWCGPPSSAKARSTKVVEKKGGSFADFDEMDAFLRKKKKKDKEISAKEVHIDNEQWTVVDHETKRHPILSAQTGFDVRRAARLFIRIVSQHMKPEILEATSESNHCCFLN